MFFTQEKILSAAKEREVIFWGCSEDWVPKSKKLLGSVTRIVDIHHQTIKSPWMGLEVFSTEILDRMSSKYFVVITTGSVDSVTEMLNNYGFTPEKDFCYSPVFEDFSAATRLTKYSSKLIFTSSDYGAKDGNRGSLLGGGIYQLVFSENECTVDKLVSGSYRQAQFDGNKLYSVDYVKNELHVFGEDFKLQKALKLNLRHYTGLSVSENRIFLISSAEDVIQIYCKKGFTLLDVIPFSDKSYSGEGLHHLNDCFYSDGYLYFTYFSKSGIWRKEIFDGGLSYLDVENKNIYDVKSDLFQPHSPKIINNQLHFCESTKGYVFSSSWNRIAKVPGFVRGICYDNGYYAFGMSETLYMKRAKNIPNVMMNTGIFVMDEISGAMRFCPTPGIKNIHSVLSLTSSGGS
ncbi:DUF4915 domain-containing protein [Pseudoalteromonas sp. JC3]|uniref:DUF4915 domain-containing protein n=1 Tax=Pseudoalteromonas sp. JC3 TaxID=2810196 RepID=UPI0019D2C2C5|nr:DUF4915 domain-containing protein [Pseudoalteromonas sp. JC3]MBR8842653.1 DUF4915 domain-containing protein [Pseudoalteromonas sp. JC3]WJE10127.1 DUF4915 domain-containing protein [Pseudoalteromonas sp. JC3]